MFQHMRRLQVSDQGSSGKVTLDKEDLEYDGLVNANGDVRDDLHVKLKHVGRGVFKVIILDRDLNPFDPTLREHRHADIELEAAD